MIQLDDSDRSLSEAHEQGVGVFNAPISCSIHLTPRKHGDAVIVPQWMGGSFWIRINEVGSGDLAIFLDATTARQLADAALKLAEKIEQASRPLSGVATGERGGES